MAAVVRMDEKLHQLLADSRPHPATPGGTAKKTPRNVRQAPVRSSSGRTFARLAPRRRSNLDRTRIDWARQVEWLLTVDYPEAERVVLVMDNLNTHTHRVVVRGIRAGQGVSAGHRLEIHYTPKHGSWLNIAEIELSVLGRQCLHRRIQNRDVLNTELAAWETHERQPAPGRWQFTTADARIKLRHLYPNEQDDALLAPAARGLAFLSVSNT